MNTKPPPPTQILGSLQVHQLFQNTWHTWKEKEAFLIPKIRSPQNWFCFLRIAVITCGILLLPNEDKFHSPTLIGDLWWLRERPLFQIVFLPDDKRWQNLGWGNTTIWKSRHGVVFWSTKWHCANHRVGDLKPASENWNDQKFQRVTQTFNSKLNLICISFA